MRVFVSYARPSLSERRALAFKDRLESELCLLAPGSTLFVDRSMHVGDHFPDELRSQLDSSDVLLVLLSSAWLKSPWCREEFNYFTRYTRDETKLRCVAPLLWAPAMEISEESDDVIARTLSQINWADWTSIRHGGFGDARKGAHFAKLAQSIARMTPQPGPPQAVYATAPTSSDLGVSQPVAGTPEAAVYGPESDYKKDIRSLMIEALAPDEIHIDRFIFNDSTTISDLEATCSRVLYAKRDSREVRRSVSNARRVAYTQNYAKHRLDDEKTALESEHGPWTRYFEQCLASKGVGDITSARILDVGHGTGQAYTVDSLFRSFRRLTAVDLSDQALAMAADSLPGLRTIVADAENLDGVKSGSQDVYLSFRTYNSTLIHRRRAVWEACRVLSPGGVAVVSIPRLYYVHRTGQTFAGLGNSQHRITQAYLWRIVNEVRQRFEAIGFRDVSHWDKSPYEIFVFARRT